MKFESKYVPSSELQANAAMISPWACIYSTLYLLGSMHSLRLTILGPMAPLEFFSQPTLLGHADK